MNPATEAFTTTWRSLAPIGRSPDGGYLRYAWSAVDLACREWFRARAAERDLTVDTDGNGNLFAWWGDPRTGRAVLTGSHFDSVPHGGAYDGPLGIVSAFLAIDLLRERGVVPARAIGVAAFVEEEGSRFGLACLGSRLLTGAIEPHRAAGLRDRDGRSLADVMADADADPAALGPDLDRISRLGAFVELHIEQGRTLTAEVGVATAIWPHGRWRMEFVGHANHAGTTRMQDRHDPMLTFADTVLAANEQAHKRGSHATVGRVVVAPNATNAIPLSVSGWLDARSPSTEDLNELVAAITRHGQRRALQDHTQLTVTAESVSALTEFDTALRDRLRARLGGVPVLATAAGHDAGVLSAVVPTAMLFVRNPTGVSHAPSEHAADADCVAGVAALATVLAELTREDV